MTVRAKFLCNSVESFGANGATIRLEAVVSGSEENESFFRWTPSGSIVIGCVNENATKQFIQGRQYYVDFTLCDTPAQGLNTCDTPAE